LNPKFSTVPGFEVLLNNRGFTFFRGIDNNNYFRSAGWSFTMINGLECRNQIRLVIAWNDNADMKVRIGSFSYTGAKLMFLQILIYG
jgi:hypothetical protein